MTHITDELTRSEQHIAQVADRHGRISHSGARLEAQIMSSHFHAVRHLLAAAARELVKIDALAMNDGLSEMTDDIGRLVDALRSTELVMLDWVTDRD